MTEVTDLKYWADFYKTGTAPEQPSLFADYVMSEYAKPGDLMMELGCGNGRDARFFAAKGVDVIGVDQCAAEIDELGTDSKSGKLEYVAADFTSMPDYDKKFDLIYSRFTLHSVDAEGQQRTLEWCSRNLTDSGKLCIETRGQKNEIYKIGTPVPGEPDAFIYENHYRRFVDLEDFTNKISQIGFTVLMAVEKTGFAPFKGTDYHFIRVIAQK